MPLALACDTDINWLGQWLLIGGHGTNGATDVLIPATGTDVSDMSLTAVYTQACGGVYFVGELAKIVHVSPQRFSYVARMRRQWTIWSVDWCNWYIKSESRQLIHLISIDAWGIVHATT